VKILVAVDLSPASEQVIRVAKRVASATGSRVFVIHCAEPEPDFVGYGAGPEVVRDQVAAEFHREHKQVQTLAQELRDADIDATALLIRGPTVDTTLKEAGRLDASLIIVGSHGRGAVFDLLVGSYSSGILKKSSVPVLVVPTRDA
jgi:nucleotide-binding universal stress UspA family protein